MSGARIGDKGHVARPGVTPGTDAKLVTRMGDVLGSPLGILVVVPALVLFIGVLSSVIGLAAVKRSSLALGREQMTARNEMVARQIGLALGQSDVMLERLRTLAAGHDPSRPLETIAFSLRDLLAGRPGVSYVSLSFPDGSFQGAYLFDDGSVRFQDSRVEASGTRVRRFGTEGREALTLVLEERTSYDPRKREFYELALKSPGAVWTKPYPFFKTHYTGITRTLAVYEPSGRVHCVLTVDFDVNRLSEYLDRIPLAGSRVLLYTKDGTLLGDPAAAAQLSSVPTPSDRALSYRDLEDPLLDAFFAAGASAGEAPATFSAGGRRFLVTRSNVGDPELGWFAASFVPEDVVLEPAGVFQRRAGMFLLASLIVAVAVAVLFSRHVVRMRKQTAEARAAATRAQAEARELGSYRLATRLGAGGMGEVWRAEHRLLAREAAIKLIRGESTPSAEAQERFRREAQTLASLKSRHTIELFDYGVTDDGTFFYVMELLDGMDLDTLVERHGPQPAARVRSLLIQACGSLAEAHAAGLVHRDIKPANLYVCRAADEVDVLKVLDFGLVRSLSDPAPSAEPTSFEDLARELDGATLERAKLTAAGAVLGTPDYMAPEQILGLETDARTDLYALGLVAYFALSGELPFPSRRDPMATMLAHLQNEPLDLLERAMQPVSKGLCALVMRCLKKRRDERPESAMALRRELVALAADDPAPWSAEASAAWWQEHVPVSPTARN
jgi:serine/threonine protein kinase